MNDNWIQTCARFGILKQPLFGMLQLEWDIDIGGKGEGNDSGSEIATAKIAKAEATRVLNVNASVFVPRSCRLCNLTESRDLFRILNNPLPKILKLIWNSESEGKGNGNGNDRALDATKAKTKTAATPKLNVNASIFVPLSKSIKSNEEPMKEQCVVPDEKWFEQRGKMAIEALNLVEPRCMRQPQDIVHITYEPINFTPKERLRVSRRIIKRQKIKRELRKGNVKMDWQDWQDEKENGAEARTEDEPEVGDATRTAKEVGAETETRAGADPKA